MAIMIFFSWWYGPGWKNAFFRITQRVDILAAEFSMGILVATLFEPWKQITSYAGPNAPIDIKFRIFFDNIFARIIGFIVRSAVLLFGAVMCLLLFIFGVILAVCWPLVPFLPIVCIILSVVNL